MNTLLQDARYALRTLWKSRSFAGVAVVTLALGIGASTAIFSVIDNVLMEPFPYKDAARMMFPRIHDQDKTDLDGRAGYSSSEFLAFSKENRVFDGLIGAQDEEVLYKQGDGTERFDGAHITPGTFEFFGMPALLGRVAQPADYAPGAPPVFVLRYKTWISRFSGDPSILNKTFILSGTPRTLIGIMPPRFGWYDADVFLPDRPAVADDSTPGKFPPIWFMLGHLKPQVSKSEAEADLTLIAKQLAQIHAREYPKHFTVQVAFLGDVVVGRVRPTLYTVLAAVALLLLIGCANVANLMLARAMAREKEFALRAVLGAGRSRLVQQLLVESLFLSVGGAALGTLLAWSGLKFIVASMPQETIPTESVIQLNAPVLAFTLFLAVLTALLFGLVPALQASRRDLNDPLRDSGKGAGGGFRNRAFQDAIVVLEVALSVILLAGAGLLMRSFVALREVHLGLQPDHILIVRLPLPQDRYKITGEVTGFFRPLLTRLKALPGVLDATEASDVPPYGGSDTDVEIPGKTHEDKWTAQFELCSEGYFPVLQAQFKSGRSFTETEVNSARKVAVVNESFVRAYLSGDDPLGRHVRLAQVAALPGGPPDQTFEIVGVAVDIKNRGLQDPVVPEVWIPYSIATSAAHGIMLRTAQAPLAMADTVRRAIWATDSGVALSYVGSMEGNISSYSYAGPRFAFLLMAIFGVVGLLLVTVGVYSLLAYNTSRKTREIGIRLALGAQVADVVALILAKGLRLVVAGIALGLGGVLLMGRLITAQLWHVSASDPATLASVAVLMLGTGVLACWIPAARASRVDPLVAIRYE
jgi:putative ABC transport system permease protein